jgi:GntR family transcriptional regulator
MGQAALSTPALGGPNPAARPSATGPARQRAVHKHVQVREYVRDLLDGAEPGTPAPSERELVHRFGVARMTVRQALDALVGEGMLERVPGRGTFVAQRRTQPVARLTSFSEDMRRRGLRPSSQTLVARLESAGPGVARALEIGEGERVVHWQRVRCGDGVPVCIENAYLNADLVPGLIERLPESLYEELGRRGMNPTWGEDSVESAAASAPEARLLDVPVGSPVLRIARRTCAEKLPVEVSRSIYRADRYTMWVPLSRHDGRP